MFNEAALDVPPMVRFTSQDDVELLGGNSRKEKKPLYSDTDAKIHMIEEEEQHKRKI